MIWDAKAKVDGSARSPGHTAAITCISLSRDESRIASASADKSIIIWDAKSGEVMLGPLLGHRNRVRWITFSLDGSRVISSSEDRTIRVWDANTGEQIGEPLRCHSGPVWSVAFSPDGLRIVSGSPDKNIFISTITDLERESWNQKCRIMDVTDGWVKDGEKLLLWIPERLRRRFQATVEIGIGEGIQESILPKVDLELLERYAGTRWTDIYKGHK